MPHPGILDTVCFEAHTSLLVIGSLTSGGLKYQFSSHFLSAQQSVSSTTSQGKFRGILVLLNAKTVPAMVKNSHPLFLAQHGPKNIWGGGACEINIYLCQKGKGTIAQTAQDVYEIITERSTS
jgi:hypothetical protein